MSYSYNDISKVLKYNPKTGGLNYINSASRSADLSKGYIRVTIDGKRVELSIPKVCWVLSRKEIPPSKVYLKDKDSVDKYKLSNLSLEPPRNDKPSIRVIHNAKYKRACVQWTYQGKRKQKTFTCAKQLGSFLAELKGG